MFKGFCIIIKFGKSTIVEEFAKKEFF